MAQRGADQLGGRFGHVHGLGFKRFADTAKASIDGWANADFDEGRVALHG